MDTLYKTAPVKLLVYSIANYNAYRDQGFDILSISLDRNREEWENAVKKDLLIQVIVPSEIAEPVSPPTIRSIP